MSAQPVHVRALTPVVTALHKIETRPDKPTLEWWRELAEQVRAARDRLLEGPIDALGRRCEFLLYGIYETTHVSTYLHGGEMVPHAEVNPGDERLFSTIIEELHAIPREELLARVRR